MLVTTGDGGLRLITVTEKGVFERKQNASRKFDAAGQQCVTCALGSTWRAPEAMPPASHPSALEKGPGVGDAAEG